MRHHHVHKAMCAAEHASADLLQQRLDICTEGGVLQVDAKLVQHMLDSHIWLSNDPAKHAVFQHVTEHTCAQTSLSSGLTSALKVSFFRYTPNSSSTCWTAVSGSPTTYKACCGSACALPNTRAQTSFSSGLTSALKVAFFR